jgi:DNA-binding NarL/FixJ family response regulator
VFVSEIRASVAELLDAGPNMNEIAHRLCVARSTVGYHAEVLCRAQRASEERQAGARRHTGPVAAVDVTKERVRQLLAAGKTRAGVAKKLGLARSTVTYHAARLGEGTDTRCGRRYDWHEIRRFYEEGHSAQECSQVRVQSG